MPNTGGFKKVNCSHGYNVTVIPLGFLQREGIIRCSNELLEKMCQKTLRLMHEE